MTIKKLESQDQLKSSDQSESSKISPHDLKIIGASGFFEKLIAFAIDQRWLVMLISLGLAMMGFVSYQHLPIDRKSVV